MGKDNACLSQIEGVSGIRSPALANLASLVIGWVALRLLVIGASLWLIGAQQTDKPSLVPNMLVARLLESASPQAIAAKGRSNFQNWPKWRKGAGPTQTDSATRNDGLPPVASIPEHTVLQPNAPSISMPRGKHNAIPAAGKRLPSAMTSRNWTLSGYALVRPGSGQAGIASNGQLGGSQLGIRAQRLLFNSGALSLSANGRISSPVRQKTGKEASLGLALKRSGRVPVELLVERRVGLDRGGRDAVAALVATGFDDFRLPGKLRLSGYAQAGVVGLKSRDGFIDGAVRAERALATIGKVDLRLGAVLAGAKQPGVSRLDLGPSVAGRFRVARASVRLAAEWRERIGGDALPGSGPAVTLGIDY